MTFKPIMAALSLLVPLFLSETASASGVQLPPPGGSATYQYAETPTQSATLQMPLQTPKGLVVFFHSGGWSGGSPSEGDYALGGMRERGYATLSVAYRLVGQGGAWPGNVQDVIASLFAVVTAQCSGDCGSSSAYWPLIQEIARKRLFVAGVSAGGHLAAYGGGFMKAYDYETRISCIVSIAGPMDFMTKEIYNLNDWNSMVVPYMANVPGTEMDKRRAISVSEQARRWTRLSNATWIFVRQSNDQMVPAASVQPMLDVLTAAGVGGSVRNFNNQPPEPGTPAVGHAMSSSLVRAYLTQMPDFCN
jgi:hypothetical protein